MRLWLRVAIAPMVLLCMTATGALAQETTGTITGIVTDETGAVLPGVTVVVRNTATARTWEFVSSGTGTYTAGQLPPGPYEVTFQLTGFQPVAVRGIRVSVNDRLRIDGKLGVTGVTEMVEVTAASQFVQPTPAVQNLMSPTQVQELPLNNRNFVQLATLVPGVSSDLGDEVGVGLTNVVSISINGARRNSVNWLVDGVANVDVGSNVTLLATPTLESIEEFKIITSSYAAEWPRSGGGIINVVTKSGTNRFAGSVYEFFRNDKLNANSFFRNLSTNRETAENPPRLRYNNFGYTVGGPIQRDRAFFFWSHEWRRISRAPGASTAFVPLPAWLNDPANPNYVAPADRDPNAVRLLEAWPAPNVAGSNTYIDTVPSINNTRQEVLRIDYDLNPSYRLTGRYTHDLSETRETGGLFFGVAVPNIAATDTLVPGNVAAVELRSIHGTALNEIKYHLSGNKISTQDVDGNRNTRSAYGLQSPELFPENNAGRIPTIVVSPNVLSTIGAGQGYNIEYWNHTVADNFTWQRGAHTYKFGALAAFEQKNENAANETQGRFTFAAGGGRTAFQNFLTGNRDGLCGTPCTYTESEIDVTNQLRFNRYEMFAQDSWQIRSNVTLDYGVRYALYPKIVDRNDILTNFVPDRFDPSRAPTFANAAGTALVPNTGDPLNGIVVAGQNSPHGRGIYGTDFKNIQPRVGFSWDPLQDGQTIVRGGYGLYFDQVLVGIFEQNAFVNPPFVNSVNVFNPSLSNPGSGAPAGTAPVRSLQATSDPFDTPRTQQWNVGVQRQLYARGTIDMGYVGSRGDNLIQPVPINNPQPADVAATGSLNRTRPFVGFGPITMRQTTAYSNYHGLLVNFRHEAGRDGLLTLNYTLSRNRTTATNDRDAIDFPQNPLDLEAEYADARSDRRHIFSATYIYELPFFRESDSALLRAVLGGWQVSGLTNVHSGPPAPRITVTDAGGTRGVYANTVGDPGAGDQAFPLWFNPAAFAVPATGTYGDTPRAPFRLPGRNQTDLAISKNWYAGDLRLQFRGEMINAFNQTQFTTVNLACSAAASGASCDTGTFGRITGARAPREVQLGLKIYW